MGLRLLEVLGNATQLEGYVGGGTRRAARLARILAQTVFKVGCMCGEILPYGKCGPHPLV